MKAVWFERKGPAAEVLQFGEMDDPHPAPGEVRIRVAYSGINPGDVKKRAGAFEDAMAYPRIVPHTDGAGIVDEVGDGVPAHWLGKPVWCSYAQTYRPFGTAAQLTTVPVGRIAEIPVGLAPAQAACLGIPGITGHRAVFADGPVTGRTVVVAGGAGSVGRAAVALARRGGATVIATVTAERQRADALAAGAHHVFVADADLVVRVRELAPAGADRIIEVSFARNIADDVKMLAPGGTVVGYATDDAEPRIPFWPMAFGNLTVRMIGYDDFPADAVALAMPEVGAAAAAGDLAYPVGAVFQLGETAAAQQAVQDRSVTGRVVVHVHD
jgi:NADPH:quinone reductase